ncbi:thioredoxin domain-containing protein [Ditylenchus destructor]|uniref:Protein disulfide-isomerase n=1 Tax=Ditylenchus destructor TaxID=166010 RepID=A0AAD4N8N1_9BILA|nr:thioredoxin domain-containing protein [Ditylenchus destructor]
MRMQKSSYILFLLFFVSCAVNRAYGAEEELSNYDETPKEESTTTTEEATESNSQEFETEDDVYVLTDDNFDAFLEKYPTVLVEFYAPWCGHCKQLAPEYSLAATQLKNSVPLAKVDATIQKELGKRYDIQGYPTIKFWKNGQAPIDYDGDRDSAGIVEWIKAKTDPNYKPPKEEVVTLTMETFDEFIQDKEIMLVEFYAPWCGHCKKLAPEYEKAAKKLKEHNIPLAKVDTTVEKKLGEQYDVKGFPTMKILRNGRRFDYDGPRDAEGIVKYMLEQSKPAAKELKTVKEAQKFMAFDDVTIIAFFNAAQGPLMDAFTEAAEKARGDFTVAWTTSKEVRKHFKANPDHIVLFYPEIFWSKYEPRTRVYSKGAATREDLLNFWREYATPLVGQKTRHNAPTRYSKLPLVVVYYNVDFSLQYRDGTQYWRNKVLDVANKYKDQKFRFAIADEEEFAQELNDLGLGDSGLEHNVVVFGVDGKKYAMDPDEFDSELEENLEAFLSKVNKGLVKPYVKSQPVPKDDKGPVRVLVGSNFAQVANDEEKDVLIEFYAPWCGHCKSFEPKYKQFAARWKQEQPNLVIAKFDATANDVPENYTVEGFPTIYFSPSGKKSKPIKYTGNRDLNDLENFVKSNAVKSFQKSADDKDEL